MRDMLGGVLANYDPRVACGVLLVAVGIFAGWTRLLFHRKSRPVLERGSRLPFDDGERSEKE